MEVELAPPAGALEAHAGALARLASRPDVAVVVPIFAAGRALSACLDALRAHAGGAQVVLVDDSSGDPEVASDTERFISDVPGSRLVVNQRNVGFVGSANTGIRASDDARDVVLLNSDTVVTDGWLAKLSAAASVLPDVATVNPLSNAADVFSLPEEKVDNSLPRGWDPELCNRVLETVSSRLYETVPATSGFCQYVRRTAIEEVGVLDDYLFHRGYGEDNDFCERATAAGFVHVVDDATFIFHERGTSFRGTRAELSRLNKAVLKALHPSHVHSSLDWERTSRLCEVRRRYGEALDRLRDIPPNEIRVELADRSTKLTITSERREDEPASDAQGLRLALTDSEARIEVHGQTTEVALRGSTVGLASWLIGRWRVTELDIVDGAIERSEEDKLRAAWKL